MPKLLHKQNQLNSAYYLLGWRPDREKQQPGRSTIQASVIGRPDLKVRTRRNYFDFPKTPPISTQAPPATLADDELKFALGSLYARRDVPTIVSAVLDTTSQQAGLEVSMRIDGSRLTLESVNGKESAIVDVLGAAIDDQGVCSTFSQKLDIPRDVLAGDHFIQWKRFLPLPAGLYQIRVAVRDRWSRRVGSAMTWIEIPKR